MKLNKSIENQISDVRTWLEVDIRALAHNLLTFRRIIGPEVKLMAVVKSNAYGHGLIDFAGGLKEAEKFIGENRGVDWFGVDTMSEALALRRFGIKRPILVLGYTLPDLFPAAVQKNISLAISTFESIRVLRGLRRQPKIHIKIDTGMHRQGFLPEQFGAVVSALRHAGLLREIEGAFTHLAAPGNTAYTKKQIREFNRAQLDFQAHGFLPLIRHAASTGGALLFPDAHFDLVRIGMGLYGYWPSEEVRKEYNRQSRSASTQMAVSLQPILEWQAIVSEVKYIPAGSYVGYDLTEKVARRTQLAVIPVGYWHGVFRGLSSKGMVLISGRRCKILGRVSMDMIVVDVTGIKAHPGDVAVLIGRQGRENITAVEWAGKMGTSHYEIVTRINPLIKKIYLAKT